MSAVRDTGATVDQQLSALQRTYIRATIDGHPVQWPVYGEQYPALALPVQTSAMALSSPPPPDRSPIGALAVYSSSALVMLNAALSVAPLQCVSSSAPLRSRTVITLELETLPPPKPKCAPAGGGCLCGCTPALRCGRDDCPHESAAGVAAVRAARESGAQG